MATHANSSQTKFKIRWRLPGKWHASSAKFVNFSCHRALLGFHTLKSLPSGASVQLSGYSVSSFINFILYVGLHSSYPSEPITAVHALHYPGQKKKKHHESLNQRQTRSLVAVEPRRPPMTDVGTETAFRPDQRKHFRKSKHLLRSEVNWCDQTSIELHLRRSTSTGE